jgi:hypothetical protein
MVFRGIYEPNNIPNSPRWCIAMLSESEAWLSLSPLVTQVDDTINTLNVPNTTDLGQNCLLLIIKSVIELPGPQNSL